MKKRKFLKHLLFFAFCFLRIGFSNTYAGVYRYTKKNAFEKINVMYDPLSLKFHLSPNHPEDPRRIKFILQELKKIGYESYLQIPQKKIDVLSAIGLVHTNEHITAIKKSYPLGFQVATAAVKSSIEALIKVCSGENRNIFCAVRPPGHHALNTGKEEGFCFFNNIAIVARYAQKVFSMKKILIVDWDYHHGNSTESFFYHDPNILFFSTHDQYAYPLTGNPNRIGSGEGKGFNINIHLPCGSGDKEIIEIFKNRLIPAVEKFEPQLILISAGFDSRIDDPLGCFEISDNGFKKLTMLVMDLAKKHTDHKIVSLLEGGYNLEGNAKAAITHIQTLVNYNP